jgi:hypothetical protein
MSAIEHCYNDYCKYNYNDTHRCQWTGIELGKDGKCTCFKSKPKEIKKIGCQIDDVSHAGLAYKINELIDVVNELRREKES